VHCSAVLFCQVCSRPSLCAIGISLASEALIQSTLLTVSNKPCPCTSSSNIGMRVRVKVRQWPKARVWIPGIQHWRDPWTAFLFACRQPAQAADSAACSWCAAVRLERHPLFQCSGRLGYEHQSDSGCDSRATLSSGAWGSSSSRT
jgi:hypothetical protein